MTEQAQSQHPVEAWLAFAGEIERFVTTPPMAGARAQVPETHVQAGRLLFFQWGRSFRTFRAIQTLVRAGFSEDAMVLVRTLLEVFFEMAFVGRNPETAVDFFDYGARTLAADLRRTREDPSSTPEMRAAIGIQEAKALARSPRQPAKPKQGPKSRWHSKYSSVRKRAIAGGVPAAYYDGMYNFASRYVHGSGDWMTEFFDPPPAGSRISYSGDSGEAALAAMWSCMCVLEQLRLLNWCLKFEVGEALDALSAKQDKLIREEGKHAYAGYEPHLGQER